jgi:hypothetical protein
VERRRDVAGRRHREDARFNQLAGDKRAGRRVAKPQRQVEPVRNKITDMVAHDQLKLHLGMLL